MAFMYRSSLDRRVSGRAGVITSPLTLRTGVDGAISTSATFASPIQVFTSATASFISTDVGRPLRLTSTPGSNSIYTISGGSGVQHIVVNGTDVSVTWATSDTNTASILATGVNSVATLAFGSGSGTFTAGETVTQATSGATGTVCVNTSATPLTLCNTTGSFDNSHTATGGSSGAHCVPTTGTLISVVTNVRAQASYNKVILSAIPGGLQTYATTKTAGTGGTMNNATMVNGNTYDGIYIIDAVNSSTSVNLRVNHNITATGAVTSPARFMETGSGITWTIPQTCTFAADGSSDFGVYTSGSYVVLEGDSNPGNNGIWQISNRTDGQHVTLSKNWFFTVPDSTVPTAILLDDPAPFLPQTGLRWSLTDRQSSIGSDAFEIVHQFLVDTGWQLWQQRGANAVQQVLRDNVYRSTGEVQTGTPDGKLVYLRMVHVGNRSSNGVYGYGGLCFAGFLAWDCTLVAEYFASATAGISRGSGIGGMSSGATTGGGTGGSRGGDFFACFPDGVGFAGMGTDLNVNMQQLVNVGRAKTLLNYQFMDFILVGDRDEVAMVFNQSGTSSNGGGGGTTPGGGQMGTAFGFLQYIGQNPNVSALSAVSVNRGTITTGAVTGTFQSGELVKQATSGATATIAANSNFTSSPLTLENVCGVFDSSHTVTGQTSGATTTPSAALVFLAQYVTTGTENMLLNYSIGDNVTIRGVNTVLSVVNQASEFIETAKIASFTQNGTLAYTGSSGTFTVNETITGGTSGATGTVLTGLSSTPFTVANITGTFVNGETVTGGTSSKTATVNGSLTSVTYNTGLSSQYRTYGNGSDTLLGQIGEDSFPWFQWQISAGGQGVTDNNGTFRLHNTSMGQNTSNPSYIGITGGTAFQGRDYSCTNAGMGGPNDTANTAQAHQAVSTYAELSPNRNSGKQGLGTVLAKNTTEGEVRGRLRHVFEGECGINTFGKKLLNQSDGNVYIQAMYQGSAPRQFGTSLGFFLGPIPKVQAGIF